MIDVVAFSFLLFIWVGVYIIYKVRGQEREEREYARFTRYRLLMKNLILPSFFGVLR